MVCPSLLVLQRAGGTPNVQRLTGGTSLSGAIDGTFGAAEGTAFTYSSEQSRSRVIDYKGSSYAISHNGSNTPIVYKRSGGSWSSVFTASANAANSARMSGLYIVNVGTTEYLIAVYDTGSATRLLRTTDGTTWTDTSMGGSIGFVFIDALVWRQRLIISTVAGINIVNVSDQIFSTIAITSQGASALHIFRNRLFVLKASASTVKARLYEISSGGFITRSGELGTSLFISNVGDRQRPVLFSIDDNRMIGIFVDYDSGLGTYANKAFKFEPSGGGFTETDISTSILNSTLRTYAAGKEDDGWLVFTDNETDPTTPAAYLWYTSSGSSSGTVSYFEYAGPATEMGPGTVTALNPNNFAIPVTTDGGGERINTTDSDLSVHDISITTIPNVPGKVLLSFKASGDPGPDDKIVKLYYSSKENPEMVQATLAGTATGGAATRSGNQVEDVDADGTTTYTVQWDVDADAQANGQPEDFMVSIETP